MNNSIVSKVATSMMLITRSLKKIPQDKQHIVSTRVQKVLLKHNVKTQELQNIKNAEKFRLSESQLTGLLKDLQFNLNFIKLSYPNINFSYEEMLKQSQQHFKKVQQENKAKENNQKNAKQKIGVQFQPQINIMIKPPPNVRQQVQFSNWAEGNMDPEKVKKHKQLLQRQFFGGDYWQNKEKPKNGAQVFLQNFLANPPMQPPKVTQEMLKNNDQNKFQDDPNERFKKIKR